MISIEVLTKMNENKKEHIFSKTDSIGNIITVVNKIEEAANEEEIRQAIEVCQIPDSYVEFLCVCNGAKLFDYEGIDGLQLLGSKEIWKYTQYAKNTFEEDWDEGIVIFAKIIGEDNYLGFKTFNDNKNQYAILDCYFEECPQDWRIIDDSFDDFLTKYLLTNGCKFWIE